MKLNPPRLRNGLRSLFRILFVSIFAIFVLSRWIVVGTTVTIASHKLIVAISAGVFWASEPYGPIEPWETSSFEVQATQIAETTRIGIVQPPHWVAWPASTPLGPRRWLVRAPLWIVVAILMISVLALGRRERRAITGHCPRCDYNLTGNTSGRCPECAQPVRSAVEARP